MSINKLLGLLFVLMATLLLLPPLAAAHSSEVRTTAGTEFVFSFSRNQGNPARLALFISSETSTSGRVNIPRLQSTIDFEVEAGFVTQVEIPISMANLFLESISNFGISVTANDPVSIYALNKRTYTTDAFLVLPVHSLGRDYLAISYQGANLGLPSHVAIVGVEDNTRVAIRSPIDIPGYPAGVPFTVNLNRMETFYFRSAFREDLTGTRITSDKPIGVTSGAQCAFVPDWVAACDHLVEMVPPIGAWGTSFITYPLAQKLRGDMIRVLASVDNTEVLVNNVSVATLSEGDYYEEIMLEASLIETSKPALVAQYALGQGMDGVLSDPFLMQIPPTEQFLDNYIFATPDPGFDHHFANIVIPTSQVGTFRLNGESYSALFTTIGSTGYSGAQIELLPGSQVVSASAPFGLYVYGFARAESYGYPGGMSTEIINPVNVDYRNARVVSYLSGVDMDLDVSSFSVQPDRVEAVGDHVEIEWHFPEFAIGEIRNLDYEVVARDLTAGESRLVTNRLELTYEDRHGVEHRRVLGEQILNVMGPGYVLGVNTGQSSYQIGSNVDISVQLANTGIIQDVVSVIVDVYDYSGNHVATVNTPPPFLFPAGESLTLSTMSFPADNLYAGRYVVHAELLSSNQDILAVASAPFDLIVEGGLIVSTQVFTGQETYVLQDEVDIHGRIINPVANTLPEGVRIVTRIISSDESVYWYQDESMGQLVANELVDFRYRVPLSESVPGSHRVVLTALDADGTTLSVSEAVFDVVENPLLALQGTVEAAVAHLNPGEEQQCTYTFTNQGANSLSGLQLETLLVRLDSEAEVSSEVETLSLGSQQSETRVRPVATNQIQPGDYACVLQVSWEGATQSIAYAQFSVGALVSHLAGSMRLGDRGRLLILLPDSTASDAREHLSIMLEAEGWFHTIVDNAEDFHGELIQGGYSAYALLGDSVDLTAATQDLIKLSVAQGDGLVVAQSDRRTNLMLEEVLGIQVQGNLAHAQGVILQRDELGDLGDELFIESRKVRGFEPLDADVAAEFLFDPSSFDPASYLGEATGFNAFVFEDFLSNASAVEGRLAVGGSLSLQHFGVGDKLDAEPLDDVVVVGGDVVFPSGRVYQGNLIAGGSIAQVGDPVVYGMVPGATVEGYRALPLDFAAEREYLEELSIRIGDLPPNGSVNLQWGGYTLNGDCSSDLQVFSIDAAELQSVHTINVACIPTGATVILNIHGETSTIQNVGIQSLSPIRERVLFNFPQAHSITLTSVGIEGSILAPFARFLNPAGSINGQVIAREWHSNHYGYVSINHYPFAGDLSSVMTESSRNAIAMHQYQQGQTIFFGFDLLAEALDQADTIGDAYDFYSSMLLAALDYTHPPVEPIRAGKVLPVVLEVYNNGTAPEIGRALLSLSENLSMVWPEDFMPVTGTSYTWNYLFELPHDQMILREIQIRMPEEPDDSAEVRWLIQSEGVSDWIDRTESVLQPQAH